MFVPLLCESPSGILGDAAHVQLDGVRVAITTDSFVVKPLSFPGGSIGELAVNGTVNDLAVSGARAEAIVVTFVLEAGLPTEILEAEVRAMAKAAREAGVSIAGGDTKVVEHGKADGMYITTTGIGRLIPGVNIDPASVRPGDKVLLSGPVGDHGITILLARGELDLEADLSSDTRSVLPLVEALVRAAGPGVRWMRDPTRGGMATSLNELARDCRRGVALYEDEVPVRDMVRGACELLGLDPFHIANEGQFLAVVARIPSATSAASAAQAPVRSVRTRIGSTVANGATPYLVEATIPATWVPCGSRHPAGLLRGASTLGAGDARVDATLEVGVGDVDPGVEDGHGDTSSAACQRSSARHIRLPIRPAGGGCGGGHGSRHEGKESGCDESFPSPHAHILTCAPDGRLSIVPAGFPAPDVARPSRVALAGGHGGPPLGEAGQPFEQVEQSATFAGEPVVAALIDLDQARLAKLTKPLRKPVLSDPEPARERAERLRGPAQLPESSK